MEEQVTKQIENSIEDVKKRSSENFEKNLKIGAAKEILEAIDNIENNLNLIKGLCKSILK